MKQYFYIFLFLVAIVPVSRAQNYFQPGSQWRINATGLSMTGPCYFNEQYVCEITGDSIIAAQTYQKISYHGVHTEGPTSPDPNSNCASPYTFNRLYALVRQEGLKIYIYEGGQEQLLYDFDLQVGDSLPLSFNNYDDHIIVDSITTIQIGNEVRNVFHFTQQNQSFQINKIIEGVGHNFGFIGIMQPFEFFETSLECFAINDTAYYPSLGAPCELNVGLSEQKELVLLNAYPNPTDATIVIETGSLGQIHRLDLVDIYGNQYSFERSTSEAGMLNLDLSSAESGVYFVRIVNEDGKVGIVRVVRL